MVDPKELYNDLALRYWIIGEAYPDIYDELASRMKASMSFGYDFDEFGDIDSQIDEMFGALEDELDDELANEEDYGRLYMGARYHELDQASPGDIGALIGRSGSSGYRGGRPTFGGGAMMSFGPVKYEGCDAGAIVLGLGALVVLGKGAGLF